MACVPPLKRKKLDVPYQVQRERAHVEKMESLKKAHFEIEKLLTSQKTQWVAGVHGLQIRQTWAIEYFLWMKVKNRQSKDAGKHTAKSQKFVPNWGGHQVQVGQGYGWRKRSEERRVGKEC